MSGDETKTVKVHPETHALLRKLSRKLGVPVIGVVRALAHATTAEYQDLENRRLDRLKKSGDEG